MGYNKESFSKTIYELIQSEKYKEPALVIPTNIKRAVSGFIINHIPRYFENPEGLRYNGVRLFHDPSLDWNKSYTFEMEVLRKYELEKVTNAE